ncbi:hypothetical protein [Candidatus Magnetobacterium casense]|uniref:Uncharacterized protein n=1 Tax=Candidatus Magnetobacterium casense TaxID=1455061 RepID=A0ABS6RWP8_9BACT|nr:hypothetical protein [Candidatus Magnetobacterium casensis]MBV6340449.1 hypothetical protein [Candidatus Magnetobacterium casensis]
MATAQELINQAYNRIGVTTIPTTSSDKGLVMLNNMISLWSIDGLLVPFRTIEYFSLVVGQSSYTIGSSGNFNTTRPLSISQVFIRDSNSVDYTIDPMSQAEYAALSHKTSDGRPEKYYYDPQYTLGKIYFDIEPSAVETLYIISEKALTELATLATSVSMPDFYKEVIVNNLAVRLAIDADHPINADLRHLAEQGILTIENYVARDKLKTPSPIDSALLYHGGGNYDITSGN